MAIDSPHESFRRLLEATAEATAHLPPSRRVVDEKSLRSAFGISPQVANNWKGRGVSQDGAMDAQRRFGASATWVLDGSKALAVTIPAHVQGSRAAVAAHCLGLPEAIELLGAALSAALPDEVREDMADALAKLARRNGSTHAQRQVLQLVPTQVVEALKSSAQTAPAPLAAEDATPSSQPRVHSGKLAATDPPKQPTKRL